MSWQMIGTLFAVIVGVVLAVAVFAMYGSTKSSATQSEGASEVAQVVTGVENLYAGQGNYTGLSVASAIKGGAIPSNMAPAGAAAASDTWGGNVVLAAAGNGFTVEFDGVPDADCVHLAQAYTADDLGGVSVNGTALALPVTVAGAEADCTTAGSGPAGGNAVLFTIN